MWQRHDMVPDSELTNLLGAQFAADIIDASKGFEQNVSALPDYSASTFNEQALRTGRKQMAFSPDEIHGSNGWSRVLPDLQHQLHARPSFLRRESEPIMALPNQRHSNEQRSDSVSSFQDQNQPLPEPCRDFLHNRCYLGDRCIYSHDIQHIRRVNPTQDGLCMEFIFGGCSLPLCRFRHDVNMVMRLLQKELDMPQSAGTNKSGVCLDYIKGKCTKGPLCQFSHTLKAYHAQVRKRKPRAAPLQSMSSPFNGVDPSLANRLVNTPARRSSGASGLRRLISSLMPSDRARADAVIAVLEAHPEIAPKLFDGLGGGAPAPPPPPPPPLPPFPRHSTFGHFGASAFTEPSAPPTHVPLIGRAPAFSVPANFMHSHSAHGGYSSRDDASSGELSFGSTTAGSSLWPSMGAGSLSAPQPLAADFAEFLAQRMSQQLRF